MLFRSVDHWKGEVSVDFFHGFYQNPRRVGLPGILLAALFGAIVGGSLVAIIVLRIVVPGAAQTPPDSIFTPEPNVEFNERDLPEYQNTAIVRATQRVLPTVVGITNKAMTYDVWHGGSVMRERATGTGVIIDSKGYIVTNNHVIEGANELSVTLSDGEEYPAQLIGADPATDLAIIKIDKEGLPVSHFGNSEALLVGEFAIAIGNPLGQAFSQSVTVGVISAKQQIGRAHV